ncbi:MAG: ABC transporter substrate binding protein, partial [Spirochaetaceae bacterium]|nr:ABC transporter substrate binding protein [Spirochaetaceae bacterium]
MKQIFFGLFLLLRISLWAETQAYSPQENILVIHSYHQGLQWTDSISAGINSVLRDENVEVHFEYLDTKRNSGEKYYQLLVEFEKQKKNLSNIDFKVIICSDNNALRFIMEYGDTLYHDVPVVFCGINNFTEEMIQNRSDITGVVESIDYTATLDLIHFLHPERHNVIFIIDRTTTGIMVKTEVEKVLADYKDVYTFEFYQDFVLDDVPERISALGDNDVIYLLTFNRDIEGKFISYFDGIKMIHQYSKVPIYGAWDFYFKNGIVGGMLTNGESQGKAAAELAREILHDVSVSDLDIITSSPNRMMFDYNEMKRFGIRRDQLPENSEIINQP